jgi:hypothetical protein
MARTPATAVVGTIVTVAATAIVPKVRRLKVRRRPKVAHRKQNNR